MYMYAVKYTYDDRRKIMKSAMVALSALLALSGVGMAASQPASTTPATVCVAVDPASGKKVKIDCASTGSIDKTDSQHKTARPRLGIDVSPWVPGL